MNYQSAFFSFFFSLYCASLLHRGFFSLLISAPAPFSFTILILLLSGELFLQGSNRCPVCHISYNDGISNFYNRNTPE